MCCLVAYSQTFPRPVQGIIDRFNETDNTNYEAVYAPCHTEFITSDLAFQGYAENQPTQGLGEVTYYYRFPNNDPSQGCPSPSTSPKVSKPIIVLDGFDPQDTRAGAEVYGKYLKYRVGVDDEFIGRIVRTQGQDVVILNFPRYETGLIIPFIYTPVPGQPPVTIPGFARIRDGGADYMERNAFVLIKLIQQLNQELRSQNSTEKITLIGPSMGGLISRYALAYMEKKLAENPTDVQWQQQWDANVKLWISFDAPHLGPTSPSATSGWSTTWRESVRMPNGHGTSGWLPQPPANCCSTTSPPIPTSLSAHPVSAMRSPAI